MLWECLYSSKDCFEDWIWFSVWLPPDQIYILKKCPYLINEMINICASLVAMAMSGRGMCVCILMLIGLFLCSLCAWSEVWFDCLYKSSVVFYFYQVASFNCGILSVGVCWRCGEIAHLWHFVDWLLVCSSPNHLTWRSWRNHSSVALCRLGICVKIFQPSHLKM